jgi:hypothetical protein
MMEQKRLDTIISDLDTSHFDKQVKILYLSIGGKSDEIRKLQKQIYVFEDQIKQIKKSKEQLIKDKITEKIGFDYSFTTIQDLHQLSYQQIDYLMVCLRGIGALDDENYDYCIGRTECSTFRLGDKFTPDRRKGIQIKEIIKESCSYCKLLFHTKDKCPKLLKMQCQHCLGVGHTAQYYRISPYKLSKMKKKIKL